MGVYKIGKKNYIDFYANGRRIRKRTNLNYKDAKTAWKSETVAVDKGTFDTTKYEQKKITFKEFAEGDYLTVHAAKKDSLQSDKNSIKALNKSFAKKLLYQITPLDVETFQTERAKEVSVCTVNRNLACLKTIFNKAIRYGKFNGKNPVKGVTFFKEKRRERFLENEEIQALFKAINELNARYPKQYAHIKPITIMALFTGMRKSEILNLKWGDINVNSKFTKVTDPKNGDPREVPINDFIISALVKVKKHPKSQYIFCDSTGNKYNNVRKSFFTACVNAGILNVLKSGKKIIISEPKESRFRFHDLRHTFAKIYLERGGNIVKLKEILGHKDFKMTLRYSHFSKDYDRSTVNSIGVYYSDLLNRDSQNVVKNAETQNFSEKADFSNSLVLQEI